MQALGTPGNLGVVVNKLVAGAQLTLPDLNQINVNASISVNGINVTLLGIAVAYANNGGNISLLISQGAAIDADTEPDSRTNKTALMICVASKIEEYVNILLKSGANVNAVRKFPSDPSRDGMTPLKYGATSTPEILTRLLKTGTANVNLAPGALKLTALHLAVKNGAIPNIQLLCQANANKFTKDAAGNTPMSLATSPALQQALQNCKGSSTIDLSGPSIPRGVGYFGGSGKTIRMRVVRKKKTNKRKTQKRR